MSLQFLPGQQVICVDSSGCPDLRLGDSYIVKHVDGDYLIVKESLGFFSSKRFSSIDVHEIYYLNEDGVRLDITGHNCKIASYGYTKSFRNQKLRSEFYGTILDLMLAGF